MQLEDEWLRLNAQPEAGGRAGIYTMGGDLQQNGHDPLELGLVDLGAAQRDGTRKLEIPILRNIALSLIVRNEVRLISVKVNEFRRDHPVMATGVFADEHPKEWMTALAKHDQALLVYAPRPMRAYKTIGEWRNQWHIGIVPVAYRADFDGFSIFPEGTTITGDLEDKDA